MMRRSFPYGLAAVLVLAVILAGCGGGPANLYTLTIAVEGAGTVTPASGASYKAGTVVTLVPTADPGYALDHWGGADGASVATNTGVHTITMNSDKSVTAVFVKLSYGLIVTVSPAGAGTVTEEIVEAKGTYEPGQIVQLTATPGAGYAFTGWTGDLTGTDNPATLALDGPKMVTANFTKIRYELIVTVSPAGAGTVTEEVIQAKGTYEQGQTVRLTAMPSAGYAFIGWTGDLTGTDNPATLTVDGDMTVTACFTAHIFEARWGSYGTGDGRFIYPYGVAADADGHVYVADTLNSRLQKFDADGTFISKWSTGAFGVAVDADGNVYVTGGSSNNIQKFSADGTLLDKWGSSGAGEGQFNDPYGVAVDTDGNVYVVDNGNHRIQKFRPAD